MATKIKVAIAGATGETGQSIMAALLAKSEQFQVFALVRPSSLTKPLLTSFTSRGATIVSTDFGSADALVPSVTGMHVVISCLTMLQRTEEMALIEASSRAKVERYVPSWFGPACPPRGVMRLRDAKEDMLDAIKRLYLPYTAIDLGWWYQLALPPLPSGRIRTKPEYALKELIGDGEQRFALSDTRDIGTWVARIIVDPRTLNRCVFAYGEVRSQKGIWEELESVAGEKVDKKVMSNGDMKTIFSTADSTLAKDPSNFPAILDLGITEYKYSLGIRGDDTPEHAKYLGYLDARELYPDVDVIPLKTFIEEMLEGKIKAVYSGA